VVGIDGQAADKKWQCISAMPSQFGDLGSWQARTRPDVPQTEGARQARIMELTQGRTSAVADTYRNRLVELWGQKGRTYRFAAAFELSEYGSQATIDELKRLFPSN